MSKATQLLSVQAEQPKTLEVLHLLSDVLQMEEVLELHQTITTNGILEEMEGLAEVLDIILVLTLAKLVVLMAEMEQPEEIDREEQDKVRRQESLEKLGVDYILLVEAEIKVLTVQLTLETVEVIRVTLPV